MEIIRLPTDHATNIFKEAARIHTENGDPRLVLPLLGQKFLTRLFFELNRAPFTGIWGAIDGNSLRGFIVGAANFQNSYIHILKKAAFPLAWYALPSLFKPRLLQDAFGILTYPFSKHDKQQRGDQQLLPTPRAEFLALTVDKTANGFIAARLLVKAMEDGFRSWGLSGYYYGSVFQDNVNANAFMKGIGFIPCGQITLHRSCVQYYRKNLQAQLEGLS